MSGTTTAFCTSTKGQLPSAQHNFAAQVTPTANLTNGATTVGSLSSSAGITHGSPVTGTGIPANTFLLWNGSTPVLSQNATATNSAVTLTVNGDTFAFALIKNGCAGTYGAASTNYSNITGSSDEVSGTGYTAGGYVWAASAATGPATSGTTAYWSWSVNPSWTAATIDCQGGMIYNQSNRGALANAAISVEDFGGEQKVTGGTLTILLPTNNSASAILRLQ